MKIRELFVLISTVSMLVSCNRSTSTTIEAFHKEDGELLNLKIKAIEGDAKAATAVYSHYASIYPSDLSAGIEWAIVGARLGDEFSRDLLNRRFSDEQHEEVLEAILNSAHAKRRQTEGKH